MGLLCILDIHVGLQSTADHSNLPDMGPIQCRTHDFLQDICDVDLQCMFLVSVHFHNTAVLLETRTESSAHPCQGITSEERASHNFIIETMLGLTDSSKINYFSSGIIQTFVQRGCHKNLEYPGQMPALSDRKPSDFPDWQSPPEKRRQKVKRDII